MQRRPWDALITVVLTLWRGHDKQGYEPDTQWRSRGNYLSHDNSDVLSIQFVCIRDVSTQGGV